MTMSDNQRVALVRRRAYKMGFRGSDLDDVQQEIAMDILGFQYQPEKSNGANEATAMIGYIDGRLATLRRSQMRYRQHVEQFVTGISDEVRYDDALAIDVREALSQLPERDRDLCEALMNRECLHDVAKRWDCSWHTVARRLVRLRSHFRKLGLDQAMGGVS